MQFFFYIIGSIGRLLRRWFVGTLLAKVTLAIILIQSDGNQNDYFCRIK